MYLGGYTHSGDKYLAGPIVYGIKVVVMLWYIKSARCPHSHDRLTLGWKVMPLALVAVV